MEKENSKISNVAAREQLVQSEAQSRGRIHETNVTR